MNGAKRGLGKCYMQKKYMCKIEMRESMLHLTRICRGGEM